MPDRRQTALGVARARFVEGLPRKARELKASLALLTGTPSEERPREELRRRLHALYASAQVFRVEPLMGALKEALALIDGVRAQRRPFEQRELDELANLAATLPALGSGAEPPVDPEAAAAEGEASAAPRPEPRPRARPTVETVVSVLVLDAPEWQARVRAALPPERFELMTADDPEEALRLARSGAPDLVLADRAMVLSPGVDLIGRLREDPLTDFVPVVLLLPPGSPLDPIAVREAGADEALVKPFDAEALLKTVARLTDIAGPAGASTLTGDLTVEEIAERLAGEVKRGLVEAAAKGKDVAIPVGDGTPLLAAAWSAIGRVRAHVAERSGGRVRFREGPQRGGPAFVTVDEGAADEDVSVDLAGRRALVVDDDPAVVWFFAGLLREHGADVVEASDGVEALEEARRRRPDLIISDILMPRLDGFGLTRALKRDPMLADVPVIVLSWKEDFLQRMRQLHVGASGYLRKEAASTKILAAVREVLKPRARLESRLRAGGDVRGRLEDVGIQTLMTTVAKERPDARLTVRDAASLYEVDLRDGELLDVSRTASDGTFARGERVLQALLGATTGRYTVADGEGAVRRSLERPLDEALEAGMTELAARVDAVSGKNLAKAVRVDLDEQVVSAVLRSSPEEVEKVVEPIRRGRGPRELLMDGEIEPQVLEEVLVDLARQGALRRVVGPEGEDRIALARDARAQGLHPELSEHEEQGTLSWLPTEETTKEILLETERMAAEAAGTPPVDLDEEELESLRPPPVPDEAEAHRPLSELEPPPAASGSEVPNLDEPFAGEPDSEPPPADDEITIETPGAPSTDDDTTLDTGAPLAADARHGTRETDGAGADRDGAEAVAAAEAADDEAADDEAADDAGGTDQDGLDDDRAADEGGEHDGDEDAAAADDADAKVDASNGRDAPDEVEIAGAYEDALDEDEDALDEDALDDDAHHDDDSHGGNDAHGDEDAPEAVDAAGRASGDDGTEADSSAPPTLKIPPSPALHPEGEEEEELRPAMLAREATEPAAGDGAPAPEPAKEPSGTEAKPEPARAVGEGAESGMRWLGWAVAVLILGAIGFVGFRLWSPAAPPEASPGPLPPTEPSAAPPPEQTPPAADEPTSAEADPAEEPAPTEADEAPADLPAPYGREEEGIASLPGVSVPDGQGLAVLEPAPGGAPMLVRIGERELRVGDEPTGLALEPGVHHLTVVRGDHQDFIWIAVRPGHTRYVPPLP